jgi:hypothetical protein
MTLPPGGLPMLKPLALTLATAVTATVFTASTAVALTCIVWDAATVYRAAADAPDRYVIARGSFIRTGPDVVIEDRAEAGYDLPDPFTYPAQFIGDLASRVGFRTPANLEVQVQVGCVASWCGWELTEGEPMLVFLQVDENRDYSLEIGPCPYWAISNPLQEDLDQIVDCMNGGPCEPEY